MYIFLGPHLSLPCGRLASNYYVYTAISANTNTINVRSNNCNITSSSNTNYNKNNNINMSNNAKIFETILV
jgi:hypothetical protein